MKNIFLVFFYAVIFQGCASMMAEYCSTNGAYTTGVNQAKNGEDMEMNYAMMCKENQDAINTSYRKGYEFALSNSKPNTIVNLNLGASSAKPICKTEYGQEVCGYGCISAYGSTKCGQNPGDNCVEAYGDIQCGKNCRESYGQILCDDK